MLALSLLWAGCAGEGDVELEFPEEALLELEGEAGELHAELRSSPQPPEQGKNQLELLVTEAGGTTPVDGLRVESRSRSPAGGQSPRATVRAESLPGGRYLIRDLDFDAAGDWELRLDATGAVEDRFVATLRVE